MTDDDATAADAVDVADRLERSARDRARALVYELDGLDDVADEQRFVSAALLAVDGDPAHTVVVDGDEPLPDRVYLPRATTTQDQAAVAAEMLETADRLADADLELRRDGSIKARSELPLRIRVRDRLVDAVDRLPWTAGGDGR